MVKRVKLLNKAKNNPRGWRYRELENLLRSWGFEIFAGRGSHFVAFHREAGKRVGLVRHSKDLSPGYVRDAVRIIEEVIELERRKNE